MIIVKAPVNDWSIEETCVLCETTVILSRDDIRFVDATKVYAWSCPTCGKVVNLRDGAVPQLIQDFLRFIRRPRHH